MATEKVIDAGLEPNEVIESIVPLPVETALPAAAAAVAKSYSSVLSSCAVTRRAILAP
jgi:hypothetical protein